MNDDKKNLKKRLAQYGMLAAAITGANEANGAVIYTDITPDFAGGVGSQYFLDLDNNAVNDFRIWHNGSSNLYISPLTATNEVLGSGGATFAYPFALSSGATISSGAGTFYNNGFSGGFQSLNYGSCSFGNWCTITDRYIGVRFDIAGNIHYGWVRLDVNQSGSVWTVKDYAYETNPGVAILAGDTGTGGTTASPATIVSGMDIADNSNGLDLQVDFAAAFDEATVGEYRVQIVKSALVGTFDLTAAEAVIPANYSSVAPTGGPTYSQVLTAASTDTDGDLIIIGQPYRVYILNMADGVNATSNSLSVAASDVTLNTTADIALSITGTDVGDLANATDLQVDFNAAANEATISEYRVFAVKTAGAGSFDLAAAQAGAVGTYESVAPGAGPYTVNYNVATTDSDGDAISLGVPYTIFVYSVADGSNANIDNLTSSASDVTLNVTTEMAQTIYGTDIDDNANGLDLQVNFTPPSNEQGILAYRVIAVKASSAGAFDLNAGLALPSTAWMFVTATGAPFYQTVFEAAKTDSDGDLIVENQPYTIFVISFANTIQATASSMASSPNDVTLISYVGLDESSLESITAYSTGEEIIINTPDELLATNVKVSLVNLNGQVISTAKLSDTKTAISTNGLVSGMYFVRFTNDAGTEKTIKMYI
jgi:hypothetical protein